MCPRHGGVADCGRDPRCQHPVSRRPGLELRLEVGNQFRQGRPGPGRGQAAQAARPATLHRGFDRSLEVGAGTGYFSLNLLRAGIVREATCTDISPGIVRRWRRTPSASGSRSGPPAPTRNRCRSPSELRPRPRARRVPPPPRPRRAFSEFHRVLRPGGRIVFAGEPSRVGDRIASMPKRGAVALAPVWRRDCGPAPQPPSEPAGSSTAADHAARAGRRHPRVRPRDLVAPRRRGRLRRRPRARRGAARELVRVVQPRARGHRGSRRRADAVAPYAFHGYLLLQRSTNGCSSRRCRRRSSTTCWSPRGVPRLAGQCPNASRVSSRCSLSASWRCPES